MEPTPSSPIPFTKDVVGFVKILQSFWFALPSPEARAARLSNAARPFSAGAGGRTSPSLRAGAWGAQSERGVDQRHVCICTRLYGDYHAGVCLVRES